MSDSYINLIFSSRSRERGLLHPDHGLPRRCTTAECGPLMTKINAHIHNYIHVHACVHIHAVICMHAHAYIHPHQMCMHNIFICMNTYFHVHAYIQSCMDTCIYTYMHRTNILACGTHVCSMHARICIHEYKSVFETFHCIRKGVSADADPHYQKLYGRVTDVCSNRKSQPSLGAMKWPRLGRYPSLIRYAPPSGKYAAPSYHRWLDLSSFT